KKVAFILIYDVLKAESGGMKKLDQLNRRATAAGYEVIGLGSNTPSDVEKLLEQYQLDLPFYTTDGTQLKTAVRSTPALLLVEEGVITGKAHWNDFESVDL
ncbi:MAG: hypothetical protein WBA16_06385, partial [Nonlabens sp.]